MYARLGTFDAPPDRLSAAIAFFEKDVVAAFERHAGFQGYSGFVDRDTGRCVGISFWDTRAALEARATTALQARTDAAKLGAITVGEPQILELAFDARK